ncbi:hypothetical protein J6590_069558 [Homalodisca vitripennis]|nr:hypothetical protein J6590_069558 [Homalodisca vitripennis]
MESPPTGVIVGRFTPRSGIPTLGVRGKCHGTELTSSGCPDSASVLGPLAAWGSPGVLTRAHPTSPLGREDPPRQGGLSGRQASPAKPRHGGMECAYADPTVHRGWLPDLRWGYSALRPGDPPGLVTRSHPTSPLGREVPPRQGGLSGRQASPASHVTGGPAISLAIRPWHPPGLDTRSLPGLLGRETD